MEVSDLILCTACLSKVKDTEDILLCSGCKLWQHRSCASDVEASFYREFYIKVIRGEKPRQWKCQYCSKNISQVKIEPDSEEQSKDMPNNPPPNSQHSEPEDSEYSFDELALSEEYDRETGEGPASLSSSLSIPTSSPTKCTSSSSPRRCSTISSTTDHHTISLPRQNNTRLTTTSSSRVNNNTFNFQEDLSANMTDFSANLSLHNTAWHEDSVSDDDDDVNLNITPTALRLPATPAATKYKFKPIYATSTAAHSLASMGPCDSCYTDAKEPCDSCSDSDDEMSPLKPPSVASTIPYCHSDSSFSDSSIEFPPPKRVSTAPQPTNENSYMDEGTNMMRSTYSSSSSDSDDEPMDTRKPVYSSDSSDDDDDDDQYIENRRPAYRWPSSSSDSSDSEEETDMKKLQLSPVTFQLINGPISGGNTFLKDSYGYTYSVKFRIGVNTFWCCTEKSTRCQATAIQNRNIITKGAANHNHPAKIPMNSSEKVTQAEEQTNIDRFASLKPDQDKISGQPPKPRVEMINTGIKEENQVLVDSNGFVYHKKDVSSEARQTTWRCVKKSKNGTCTGSVRIGDNFLVAKLHNHVGDHKKVTELRIKSKIKAYIERHPSKTPAQIINQILGEMNQTRQSLTKAGYQALMKHVRKQKQTLKCF